MPKRTGVREELDSAALKDPLVYGMTYIDLLQGRKWQYRPWQVEPYRAVNPYYIEKDPIGRARKMAIMKATQVGVSLMMAVKMFHFADYWMVRLMYMLPRQQDYIDFVGTRIDPMIAASSRLKNLIGDPNSTRSKKLAESFLYFMESSVEPRMMPADAIYIDEVDLSEPQHMGTALNRMDDSDWGLTYYLSTPTTPNSGIHGRYLLSDQRKWLVKCPHCGEWQELEWENNLQVIGNHEDPDEVNYICYNCRKALTIDDIQENGEWVAEKPEKTSEMIGYHVSQMMVHPASVLWGHWIDPQQTEVEFYRKRLGKPYEMGGGSLDREDFLINCFHEPYAPEFANDGESQYYLGADQGNELQVVVAKVEKGRKSPKIVKIEIVPESAGFERIAKLIRIFRVKRAVVDADPNRHSVRNLQKKFPGIVIMADYKGIDDKIRIKKDDNNVTDAVLINRTEGFDDLMRSVREGFWQLPGEASSLPPDVELFISHMTSLRRSIETRKLQSGTKEVAVWTNFRPDHLAHATLYAKVAIEIDKGRGTFKSIVIGKNKKQGSPSDIDEKDKEILAEEGIKKPHKAITIEIVALLAEVPQDQIIEYMVNRKNETYEIPFPLSFKRKKAIDIYGEDDVEWTIAWMANNESRVVAEISP